jgi:hypothetical protein
MADRNNDAARPGAAARAKSRRRTRQIVTAARQRIETALQDLASAQHQTEVARAELTQFEQALVHSDQEIVDHTVAAQQAANTLADTQQRNSRIGQQVQGARAHISTAEHNEAAAEQAVIDAEMQAEMAEARAQWAEAPIPADPPPAAASGGSARA